MFETWQSQWLLLTASKKDTINFSIFFHQTCKYNFIPLNCFMISFLLNFLSSQPVFLQRLASFLPREKCFTQICIKMNCKAIQNVDFLAGVYLLWRGKEWNLSIKMMKLGTHLPSALCMLLKCIINLEHSMFCQMKRNPIKTANFNISDVPLFNRLHEVFVNNKNARRMCIF